MLQTKAIQQSLMRGMQGYRAAPVKVVPWKCAPVPVSSRTVSFLSATLPLWTVAPVVEALRTESVICSFRGAGVRTVSVLGPRWSSRVKGHERAETKCSALWTSRASAACSKSIKRRRASEMNGVEGQACSVSGIPETQNDGLWCTLVWQFAYCVWRAVA